MTINIGILTVKGMDYHSTARLAQAAAARGARVVAIDPYGVYPAYDGGSPHLQGNPEASTVQAVMPRQGAEIRAACLPLIAHYEQMGVRVINGLRAITMARNKFFMLQAMARNALPVPDTVYATSIRGCRQARDLFAPNAAVLKIISGRQGTGVHLLSPEAALPTDIEAQLVDRRGVLVQEYVPPQGRRDYRILVIGDDVAGAVSLRPPDGDFRTNAHLGGTPAPVDLAPQTAGMALRAARAMEMEIAGVDLMFAGDGRPMVMEVNSAPGFRALEAASGKDMAGLMIAYVLSECTRT